MRPQRGTKKLGGVCYKGEAKLPIDICITCIIVVGIEVDIYI